MNINLQHTKIFGELLESLDYRYVVNEGGTRSSKTVSELEYLIHIALTSPNRGLVFHPYRKELTSCRRTLLVDFLEILHRWNIFNLVQYNKSESAFILNGNTFVFCGADDPQKLRGMKRDYLFINEANEFDYEDFKQLSMRTSTQILLDYNPSFTDSWIYELIEMKSGKTSAEIMQLCKDNHNVFECWNTEIINNQTYTTGLKLIQSTYKDNPFLSPHIIKEIEDLKKFDDNDYNIYALGIRSQSSGLMFKRLSYQHYNELPNRRIGLLYCDPNVALKGKGDTTAIVKLYYSLTDGKFYISDVVCRSFSNPNDLLDTLGNLLSADCRKIGFDGNFAQESHWTSHVRSYSQEKGLPFPIIDYKRYRVDDTSKTTQYLWNDKQIYFNPNIEETEDGKRFINQVLQFNGKKRTEKGQHDDAPDALICAINYMFDLGFVQSNSTKDLINLIYKKGK